MNVAAQNHVWGAAPDITAGDVTFPVCPAGSPGPAPMPASVSTCFATSGRRQPAADVLRPLVGVADQGVQATATAEVLFGDSTDACKPLAIADKWVETPQRPRTRVDASDDTFERYDRTATIAARC